MIECKETAKHETRQEQTLGFAPAEFHKVRELKKG